MEGRLTVVPSGGTDLEQYDPQKGLQQIAVADAAITHFRRAKDPEKLSAAVEAKLAGQREFIRWYVAQPKDRGGRPSAKTGNGTVTGLSLDIPALFGLDPSDDNGVKAVLMMLGRWRKALLSDEAYDRTLEDSRTRVLRICEQQPLGTVRGTEGTGEFELYTPEEYIEAARKTLGEIDLDPASNDVAQQVVRAGRFFTAADDGLKRDWFGHVWLNPPYHRDLLPAFVAKMVQEVEAKRVSAAIMLTNNCTDTDWFLRAYKACSAICFTHGRIRFYRPAGEEVAPTQGQAFFYFGDDVERFSDVFSSVGFGVVPRWTYAK